MSNPYAGDETRGRLADAAPTMPRWLLTIRAEATTSPKARGAAQALPISILDFSCLKWPFYENYISRLSEHSAPNGRLGPREQVGNRDALASRARIAQTMR